MTGWKTVVRRSTVSLCLPYPKCKDTFLSSTEPPMQWVPVFVVVQTLPCRVMEYIRHYILHPLKPPWRDFSSNLHLGRAIAQAVNHKILMGKLRIPPQRSLCRICDRIIGPPPIIIPSMFFTTSSKAGTSGPFGTALSRDSVSTHSQICYAKLFCFLIH